MDNEILNAAPDLDRRALLPMLGGLALVGAAFAQAPQALAAAPAAPDRSASSDELAGCSARARASAPRLAQPQNGAERAPFGIDARHLPAAR